MRVCRRELALFLQTADIFSLKRIIKIPELLEIHHHKGDQSIFNECISCASRVNRFSRTTSTKDSLLHRGLKSVKRPSGGGPCSIFSFFSEMNFEGIWWARDFMSSWKVFAVWHEGGGSDDDAILLGTREDPWLLGSYLEFGEILLRVSISSSLLTTPTQNLIQWF